MIESILLVDDEDGIRRVLSLDLEDAGLQVHTAADGLEALEIFRRERPPVVLTDIKMPGLDGLELLAEIKKLAPETEVIMMTGHGDMNLAVKSLKQEATDFMTKPISGEALEVALKRAEDRIETRKRLKDYTENLEKMVEEKTNRLLEAERLAAVGQTTAALSHAIKNIAGGLEGGVFVLEKGLELDHPEYRRQGWDMVKANLEKIKRLSLDLLSLAKPASLNLTRSDPARPAREVYDLMKLAARNRGVELSLEIDEGLDRIYFDFEGVHKCLLNLTTNALDAVTEEDSPDDRKKVVLKAEADAAWGVVYRVIDSGPGLSPEVREKVFSMFFTTKGSQGSGLGLMITRKIVEEHGGVIEVESEYGRGASFIVKLPPNHPEGEGD